MARLAARCTRVVESRTFASQRLDDLRALLDGLEQDLRIDRELGPAAAAAALAAVARRGSVTAESFTNRKRSGHIQIPRYGYHVSVHGCCE